MNYIGGMTVYVYESDECFKIIFKKKVGYNMENEFI